MSRTGSRLDKDFSRIIIFATKKILIYCLPVIINIR